jgi:hypothetical protein
LAAPIAEEATSFESGGDDNAAAADSVGKAHSFFSAIADVGHGQVLYNEGKVPEAARLGLPVAQAEMAEACYFGLGNTERDVVQGFEWASKAAQAGDVCGEHRLGWAYYEGEGVGQDWQLAIKWYEKAAAHGDGISMSNIGYIYDAGGSNVAPDVVKAEAWYRRAAKAGDLNGLINLGVSLYEGAGSDSGGGGSTSARMAEARGFFAAAAAQGSPMGQGRLGFMLVKGEGGPADMPQGIALLCDAAAGGDETAAHQIDAMMLSLTWP